LNKTRSEIKAKDHVVEEQEDVGKSFQNAVSKNAFLNKTANSAFSRSICQTLFEALPVTKNEFFQRGRMAYVVELEDEQADIPVTLLRSTFECANDKSEQNINANNALINVSVVILFTKS
jgi:IK cytokine